MPNAVLETVTDSRGILRTAREILRYPMRARGTTAKTRGLGF